MVRSFVHGKKLNNSFILNLWLVNYFTLTMLTGCQDNNTLILRCLKPLADLVKKTNFI